MTEQRFEATNISKIFFDGSRRLEVLSGVDLKLRAGEMAAVVGVSGTGKTTLLHILGTLDRPDQGKLLYNDKNIFRMDDTELSCFRNETIGFVFQFHHLLPEFSALENIIMPGMIAGQDGRELLDRGHDLLDKVGLGNRADHKPGELSGGEQQRVALARALIMKPALLLADEPTGNLDPRTGNKIFELIQRMNEDFNLSTVMVTHNYQLAGQMNRCFTLENGRLVAEDIRQSGEKFH